MSDVASTAHTRPPAVVIPFGQLFRSEIAEAKRLGYMPQLRTTESVVIVRLMPRTARAKRHAAVAAPEGTTDPAIQAVADCPSTDTTVRLDVVRETFATALVLARDAAA